jgi:hypothetical protein
MVQIHLGPLPIRPGQKQRYQAVREVLNDGALVTDVARRRGVSRQTVHEWLVKYANHGLVGLMDRSSKPQSCPHQMSPQVEARIVELRTEHPGWGPRTLRHRLGLEGFAPVPGRTSIYRWPCSTDPRAPCAVLRSWPSPSGH